MTSLLIRLVLSFVDFECLPKNLANGSQFGLVLFLINSVLVPTVRFRKLVPMVLVPTIPNFLSIIIYVDCIWSIEISSTSIAPDVPTP